MSTRIFLDAIRLDGGTQPRAALDEALVSEYADAMASGAVFPDVIVFHDGADYWLADGFHRYHAARLAETVGIEATIHVGTRRDAVLYSVGANTAHGLRRTNDDKRKSVSTLLADAEWSQWSDREIARRCGVSDRTVNKYREELTAKDSQSGFRTVTTKHGTVTTMQTANIGTGHGSKKAKVIAALDTMAGASDAAIAEAIGIDVATVQKARLDAGVPGGRLAEIDAAAYRRVSEFLAGPVVGITMALRESLAPRPVAKRDTGSQLESALAVAAPDEIEYWREVLGELVAAAKQVQANFRGVA